MPSANPLILKNPRFFSFWEGAGVRVICPLYGRFSLSPHSSLSEGGKTFFPNL